jgi:membrane-bound lytic murein transglycosylase A
LPVAAVAAHSRLGAKRAIHATSQHTRNLPYPQLELPLQINGSQYEPLAWSDIAGWATDDHVAAYKTFRTSCRPIAAQYGLPGESKALGVSLRDPCRIAKGLEISEGAKARAFFEEHFRPLRISRLGEGEGFVTGYYEPILEGSRTQSDIYNVPVYRRPSNLFVRGTNQSSAGLPNKGQVFRADPGLGADQA